MCPLLSRFSDQLGKFFLVKRGRLALPYYRYSWGLVAYLLHKNFRLQGIIIGGRRISINFQKLFILVIRDLRVRDFFVILWIIFIQHSFKVPSKFGYPYYNFTHFPNVLSKSNIIQENLICSRIGFHFSKCLLEFDLYT